MSKNYLHQRNNHHMNLIIKNMNLLSTSYMDKTACIHLILYSNGEPYTSTKKKIIETIHNFSKYKVIIHDYNLERISTLDWFYYIKDLPNINHLIEGDGKRDGYYNCWKAFITRDVFLQMKDIDILYYVDCSKYFLEGFTSNIDKLCNFAFKNGCIAGSVGSKSNNNTVWCCDKLEIWNKIIPNNNNSIFLEKKHVLNSWFIMAKNDTNKNFIDDWIYYCIYKDDSLIYPLITYHHTADQSIFNILVYKYKLPVFFNENISHDENKDKNRVLKIVNNSNNIGNNFIILK